MGSHICATIYAQSYMLNDMWVLIYVQRYIVVHICATIYGCSYVCNDIWVTIYGRSYMLDHICMFIYDVIYGYSYRKLFLHIARNEHALASL